MASTFNRILASGTSAGSTLVTIGAGKTWVVIGMMVANVADTLVTIDVSLGASSLADNIPLPAGSSLSLLDGKLVLIEGDTITEECSTDAGVDYIISYMETD